MVPAVQNHAADELHVEMAHAQRPPGRLSRRRERLRQQIVEGLAVVEPLAVLRGQRGKTIVRKGGELGLDLIDAGNDSLELAQLPALAESQQFAQDIRHVYNTF